MGQNAPGRLSSSSVTLPAGGRAGPGHRARGRSAAAGPGAPAVGRPTVHGGPVSFRPVRAIRLVSCILGTVP